MQILRQREEVIHIGLLTTISPQVRLNIHQVRMQCFYCDEIVGDADVESVIGHLVPRMDYNLAERVSTEDVVA